MTNFDPQSGRDVPSDDDVSRSQLEADSRDLADAVQGLAGLISRVDDIEAALRDVARLALSATPNADGAGVTVLARGENARVLTWAVTDPFVREIDRMQYEVCDEGPCLTAMQTRRPLTSGSLGSDARWRRFGGRVARLRVHSALALPLIVRDEVVGALNIYARQRDAFCERSVIQGEHFAGAAAVAVGNMRLLHEAHTRATQLQEALTSRAVIDQAIGIVRSRSGVSAEDAFDRLRQMSQAENVKLSVVAARLVDEAVRRARSRASESPSD